MLIKKLALVFLLGGLPLPLAAQELNSGPAAAHTPASAGESDLASVLKSLSERHGFSLSGLSYLKSEPVSVVLSGDLAADLQRLLRNANFVLTYGTENGNSKIERVTIIDARFGSKQPVEQVGVPDRDTLQSFAAP